MKETIPVTGMVIGTMPMAEYDKRLLILTRELGKISAFAKGSRRPNNPLMAASRLFCFGTFELYEGRNAYTVREVSVRETFDFLSGDMELMCYASYFAEFADYYGREGLDGSAQLLLLYAALLALKSGKLPPELVRRIYELKAMALEGEYFPEFTETEEEAAAYAWRYVLDEPPGKVFSFLLEERAALAFSRQVDRQKERYIDRPFHSLEISRWFRLIPSPASTIR